MKSSLRLPKNCKCSTWYSANNGQSPGKTLGLDSDEKRAAMAFCTFRSSVLPGAKCLKCQSCCLPEFYRLAREHSKEDWPVIAPSEKERIINAYFSPEFSIPGFPNFPEGPQRKITASIQAVEPPSPDGGGDFVADCVRYALRMHKLIHSAGGKPYMVFHRNKRALAAAAFFLNQQAPIPRESELQTDKTLDQAKAEAAERGESTVTVKLREKQRVSFDSWVREIENYCKTGQSFPLRDAILESLRRLPCSISAV